MAKLNILMDSDKIAAVKKAIGGDRVVFDSLDEAKAKFEAAKAAAGEDVIALAADDSAFDAGTYEVEVTVGEGDEAKTEIQERPVMQAALAVVGARVRDSKGTMQPGIRGIVLFPIPSAQALINEAFDWIEKIAEKEAAHVAFRGLRNSESVEEFEGEFNSMPRSVSDFVASHRATSTFDSEAFDAMWPTIRADLKANLPALAEWLPPKAETLRAIRSKAYAEQEHNELESRDLFVWLANSMIEAAAQWKDEKGEPAPIDASAIQGWVDGRDELDLSRKTEEKDESKLDALKAQLGF